MASVAFAFDELAADYDKQFTDSPIGSRMRRAVWRRLDSCFPPGSRVLELNCGTGEDALYLGRRGVRVLATDLSPTMVAVARHKVARAGLAGMIEVQQLGLDQVDQIEAAPFDGALSNFGGLNCVADLPAVGRGWAARLRPGATALVCIMGPVVPWEWLWFVLHRQPAKAFRRLCPGGVEWRGLTIHYPSIWTLQRAFAPAFQRRRVSAIGALIPPPYTDPWTASRPRLLERLDRWERRWETVPPLPWLADHYLLELERV